MPFDPNAFLGTAPSKQPMTSPTENAAPLDAPASAKAPTGFDPNRFLSGGKATDPLTGEEIPLAYSGNTPETAMNRSPLSATDRMKLSFGNEQGNINYLKEKFADAKVMTGPDGKPSKEIAVRQGNTWFRVDPKNGDIADPWEKTKEYIKDAASFAPEALGIGAAIGADIATGGGSMAATGAIAGASTAAIRTSLGRLIGTYDATPAEQAWDIGFESLLNAAGGKILGGVKPTAKWIARNALDPMAAAFKDVVAGTAVERGATALAGLPKDVFKKVFASYSVGENNFDTMVENTDAVKSTMSRLSDMAGRDVQGYHDQAIRDQVGYVAKIAGDTRQTLSSIYGNMRNQLLAKVPADFSVNLEDSVYSAYKGALEKGLGVIKVGKETLSGPKALDYLAKNGTSKASFSLLSQDELKIAIQQGAPLDQGVGYLAVDKEAHGILSEFYKNLEAFAGGQNRTGTEGARALLDFKKVATDLAHKSVNSEAAQGINEVRFMINDAKAQIDNSVFQELKKHGVASEFTNLNQTYDKLSTGFAPLLNAQKRAIASGDTKAYEGLLSTFLARPKPSASARFAVDDAIQAADANGLKALADSLRQQKLGIQVTEAAKAFNPIKPGILKAADVGGGAVGLYALASHNPALLAAMVGMKAVSSPQGAKMAIATTQSLSKGQQMLSSFTKKQADVFLSSEPAMASFVQGVVQAPLVRAQVDQAMQGMVQNATQRPETAFGMK